MSHKQIRFKPLDGEVMAIAERHGCQPQATLDVLRELDQKRGGLSGETIEQVALALHLPPAQVYGVATFYSMLSLQPRQKTLRVCDGPACWLKWHRHGKGPETLLQAWREALTAPGWTVERTSCLGLCDRAPALLVEEAAAGPAYPEDASRLLEGWRGVTMDYRQPRPGEVRVMTALLGKIDPSSIDDALAHGVYEGLKRALQQPPEAVIAEVEASGLQGRGGAGFPTGRKWRFVAAESRTPRYVICNADESEPLTFKDRVLIESNPHQLLEGLLVAGYACGASEGWIYIRGEYEAQARLLEQAIAQAEARGLLGEHILGSNFSFRIHVHRGAGAYICGEETALIESLEGKRGEPRLRPPYPSQSGLYGQPTAVNNVETLCAVPHILRHGAAWWRSLSADVTPGTKLYLLLGHVQRPGLFEAPFGLTLRQLIEDFGGGMLPGRRFGFALCGGAAGYFASPAMLDAYADYTTGPLKGVTRAEVTPAPGRWEKTIPMGSGAFLVCDDSVSPLALLREVMHFFAAESCGKCTPCRVGTWRSKEILDRLVAGQGSSQEKEELLALAELMRSSSFCGLGQSTAMPIHSALALVNGGK